MKTMVFLFSPCVQQMIKLRCTTVLFYLSHSLCTEGSPARPDLLEKAVCLCTTQFVGVQSESLKSVFYMYLSSLGATVLHLNFMQEQRHMRTSLTANHSSILAITHESLVSGHNVPHNKLLLIKPAQSQKFHCVRCVQCQLLQSG